MIYFVWSDGTYVAREEYEDIEYQFMSDDFTIVNMPEEFEEDSAEFNHVIETALTHKKGDNHG